MKHLIFPAALVLSACASAPSAEAPAAVTTAPVIAAERAFAARAGEIAWIPAFREFVAPDGQLGSPNGFTDAPAQLAESEDDGNRNLFWWPAFAGIARSGDFGFTTGPVSFDEARTPRGHYFTVWRRQPDGSWKWIYDGGVGPIGEPNLIEPGAANVPSLPVATTSAGSAEAAVSEVRALEEGARSGALAARLAPEAQVFRSRNARGVGATAPAAMAVPSADVAYTATRVEAASSGDMVMVLGNATWSGEGGAATQSIFARVWQRRAEGWRIVFDQLILPRPPAPAAN